MCGGITSKNTKSSEAIYNIQENEDAIQLFPLAPLQVALMQIAPSHNAIFVYYALNEPLQYRSIWTSHRPKWICEMHEPLTPLTPMHWDDTAYKLRKICLLIDAYWLELGVLSQCQVSPSEARMRCGPMFQNTRSAAPRCAWYCLHGSTSLP